MSVNKAYARAHKCQLILNKVNPVTEALSIGYMGYSDHIDSLKSAINEAHYSADRIDPGLFARIIKFIKTENRRVRIEINQVLQVLEENRKVYKNQFDFLKRHFSVSAKQYASDNIRPYEIKLDQLENLSHELSLLQKAEVLKLQSLNQFIKLYNYHKKQGHHQKASHLIDDYLVGIARNFINEHPPATPLNEAQIKKLSTYNGSLQEGLAELLQQNLSQ